MYTDRDFAELMASWNAHEAGSDERLFAYMYAELRKIAARQLWKESPGHTLQATALANEAYMRLSRGARRPCDDQVHFCALAARTMHQILVDHARQRYSAKRGGQRTESPLDVFVQAASDKVDLVELDMALEHLRQLDPREASVVELRFFAGLTVPEIAQALGVSIATVERDWVAARAWLRRELSSPESLS